MYFSIVEFRHELTSTGWAILRSRRGRYGNNLVAFQEDTQHNTTYRSCCSLPLIISSRNVQEVISILLRFYWHSSKSDNAVVRNFKKARKGIIQ
uniref:Uncharacterized protein n=1 Tax=Ascaris lumbricoides TaxID=6252 RepID=A0A9J2PJ10_ASCLU